MQSTPVEHYLEDLRMVDEDRLALVLRLRKMILAVDPKVTEEVRYGGLLFTAGSPFCGIFSYPRHVALEFSRGADLQDQHHVLEGEGKKRRHIKIEVDGDLFKKNVSAYVALAFAAASASHARHTRAKARG